MIPSKELTGLIGFIALVLSYFKINIGSEEIQTLVGAGLVAFTILKSWYERYQKGEISLGGLTK